MDQSQYRQILTEILESPEFKESQRYRELLQYLAEESIAGRTPKESTIGMQFFGKDPDFNSKEDATVRVYLNTLRKKLEHYYLTSDKPHAYKLSIPLGHYRVEFIPAAHKDGRPSRRSRFLRFGTISGLVLSAFVLGYLTSSFTQDPEVSIQAPNPIWADFVRPDARPILVVLGDYFFLRERAQISAYYRRVTINTPEDFQRLIARDPALAKRYEVNNFTFLRPSSFYGVLQILPIIQRAPNGYAIKLASHVTLTDFKSHNVVFIGPFKTLFGFQKFLHIFGIEYPGDSSTVNISNQRDGSVHQFSIGDQRGGTYERDFAFIAKGTGPEGSTILMLLGFAETGVTESAKAACDGLLFRAIETKFPLPPSVDLRYFTLVIATEGISQTIFNADIRYFVVNKPLSDITDSQPKDTTTNR